MGPHSRPACYCCLPFPSLTPLSSGENQWERFVQPPGGSSGSGCHKWWMLVTFSTKAIHLSLWIYRSRKGEFAEKALPFWTQCKGLFKIIDCLSFLFFSFFFFFFCFLGLHPEAYGGSQARGQVGAVAAGLCQSHSSLGSKPRLQPTPQLTAMLNIWLTEQGQGSNLHPHEY